MLECKTILGTDQKFIFVIFKTNGDSLKFGTRVFDCFLGLGVDGTERLGRTELFCNFIQHVSFGAVKSGRVSR